MVLELRIYYRLNDVSNEEVEDDEKKKKKRKKKKKGKKKKEDPNPACKNRRKCIFRVQLESQKHFTQKNC